MPITCACLAPDARGLRFARVGRVPPARAARCLPCACTPCACSPVRGRTADESMNQTTPRSIRAARRRIGGEPDMSVSSPAPPGPGPRGPRRAAAVTRLGRQGLRVVIRMECSADRSRR